jgi:hypothetical protein
MAATRLADLNFPADTIFELIWKYLIRCGLLVAGFPVEQSLVLLL